MTTNTPTITDPQYWQWRYQEGNLTWDMGSISPPIKSYIDQLPESSKEQAILIAGAGNAHEVGYLYQQGFKNVILVDIAPQPIENFAKRYPDFPKKQLICADFFTLSSEDYQFDLILEQTFFCAIDPKYRDDYVKQMHALLKPSGKLVGVLFNKEFPHNQDSKTPPFGGNQSEYRQRFNHYFQIECMQPCYNSHQMRAGDELFVIMKPKSL